MNILVLAPDLPYPLNRGTHQRSYHLLKMLSASHRVTLFSLHQHDLTEQAVQVFREFCAQVVVHKVSLNPWRKLAQRLGDKRPESMRHWLLSSVNKKLKKLLAEQHFELVYCQDIAMTQYLLDLPYHGAVITDRSRVDSEFQREQWKHLDGVSRKISAAENLAKTLVFERQLARRYPHQLVCSHEDKRYIQRWTNPQVAPMVLENGVDTNFFHATTEPNNTKARLVFTGTMDYRPNHDAMMWFKQQILPRVRSKLGNVQLWIVGLNPPTDIQQWHDGENIVVTGAVDDIRPYYAMADIFICPLRIGGGTRLKLVEAMAMRRPVVTTRVGAQGLAMEHKQHVRYADDASQFAKEVVDLLKNPAQSHAMASQGHDFVKKNYCWSVLARRLDNYLGTLSQLPVTR